MTLLMVGWAFASEMSCDEVLGMVELGLDDAVILRAVEGASIPKEDAACLMDSDVSADIKFWAAGAVTAPGELRDPEPEAEEGPIELDAPRDAPRLVPAVAPASIPIDAGGGRSREVVDAERFVWVGVDYSLVRMVGSDFADPDSIFPGHVDQWNSRLAEHEAMRTLAWALDEPVKPVVSHLQAAHAGVDASERIQSGPGGENLIGEIRLSPEDLAHAVRRYELPEESGVGLVFVMESMLKEAETACMHAVFFTVEEREVLESARLCAPASGMTFSTHWQAPIERAIRDLRRELVVWERSATAPG